MPNIKLTWDYSENDPLPETVEVYRDGVVIHTENNPITEYIDFVTQNSENNGSFLYQVKSINGDIFRLSENLTVLIGGGEFVKFTLNSLSSLKSLDSDGNNQIFTLDGVPEGGYSFTERGIKFNQRSGNLLYGWDQSSYNLPKILMDDSGYVEFYANISSYSSSGYYLFYITGSGGSSEALGLSIDLSSGRFCLIAHGELLFYSDNPVVLDKDYKIKLVRGADSYVSLYLDDILQGTAYVAPSNDYKYLRIAGWNAENIDAEFWNLSFDK